MKRVKLNLVEHVYGDSSPRIDREKCVIFGVKILGRNSRNHREYLQPALESAAEQYEGMTVNLNHPDKQALKKARGIEEKWGWLENVNVKDDGVYGDLHYLKSHQYTEPLLEMAERNPKQFGLSHNADGTGYQKDGRKIIESVEKVRSVDVVQRPATTDGLFEHVEDEGPMKKTTLKQLVAGIPEGTKHRKLVKAIVEMDGMADMDSMGEVPVEVASDATPEDQVWEGFRSAVISVLDNSDMDIAETIKKITEILSGYDKSFGTPSGGGETDTETPVTEGVNELLQKVKRLEDEGKARAILEEHDVKATGGRLKAVVAVMESEDDLEELIDSFPKRSASQPQERSKSKRPERSAPLVESEEEAPSALKYKDRSEFARLVR